MNHSGRNGFSFLETLVSMFLMTGLMAMSLQFWIQLNQQHESLIVHAQTRGQWYRFADAWRMLAGKTQAVDVQIDRDLVRLRSTGYVHLFQVVHPTSRTGPSAIEYRAIPAESGLPSRRDLYVLGSVENIRFEMDADQSRLRAMWDLKPSSLFPFSPGDSIEIIGQLLTPPATGLLENATSATEDRL